MLVYKLDRFSRNKYEMAIHRKRLSDNGIKLISVMENIPDSPEGILLESLLEGINEYYSAELSQKTKRGMNETRLKGNFIGGVPNFGYSLNGKKLIINEEEAAVLKGIFTDYANGKCICDILKDLTERGIFNRGKTFKHASIYFMLGQEKYTGIYKVNGTVYDKIYPPIIPKDIYDIVRKRIDANKYGKHVQDIEYLLRGKAVCGYCGKTLNSQTGTSLDGTIHRYYRCLGIKKRTGCEYKSWRKDKLEKVVLDAVLNAASTKDNLDFLLDKIMEKQQASAADNTILHILEKELSKTNKSLANVMTAIEAGIFTDTTKQRLQELEIFKRDLEEKILIEKSNTRVTLKREDAERYIRHALKQKPKTLIELLLKKGIVFKDKVKVILKYAKDLPDNDPTDNDPDGNSPDRGLAIIQYPIIVERTKCGRTPKRSNVNTHMEEVIIQIMI